MSISFPKRRQLRLPDWDYARAGAYFVTICADKRRCYFGEIVDFRMQLNEVGHLVASCWTLVPNHFPFVTLDQWVLMPNHLHGILWLGDDNPARKSLSAIISAFKAVSTSQVRKVLNHRVVLWQRGFYDHIIRDEDDLHRIRDYIANNPAQWAVDGENPEREKTGGYNPPLRP